MERLPDHWPLSADLRLFVEQERARLGFDTPAAYLESLVQQARRQAAHQRAEKLVAEGMASGEPVVADEAFWTRFTRELNSRIRHPKTA